MAGGAHGAGTVFKATTGKIAAGPKFATLYSFCSLTNCADGSSPQAGLIQDTNGDFYGTALSGGAYFYGTVFSLSVGLGPFVETQTSSGKVGAAVTILGSNLVDVLLVLFNGTPATLTAVSKSAITTTVPTGATTGPAQVYLLNGTTLTVLTSNKNFTVIP